MTSVIDPLALARDDANAVLRTQYDGDAAVLVDSVPGAGKTRLIERLGIQSAAVFQQRCMIATQTNAQAIDLARRFGEGWPRHPVTLFVTGEREPAAIAAVAPFANVRVVHQTRDIPGGGPCIVIATAHRWSWSELAGHGPAFHVQLVDESYQVPDYVWVQIADLAPRWVLVGDPGQIAPVIDVDVTRWVDDPAGPHVPAPRALLARGKPVRRLALRVTHRLSAETVDYVGPAFYPEMTMRAAIGAGGRRLDLTAAGLLPPDRLIDLAARGGGIVMAELPPRAAGEVDDGVVAAIVAIVERLARRGARIGDEQGIRILEPGQIGIVCTHVSQVSAIRALLPAALADVRVETANRWQGLQADVTLVYHPLSGRGDVGEFHLDAGRLCVMLTRHRVASLVITRGGLQELIERHVPLGERVPGVDDDPEYQGWRSHRELLRRLDGDGRIVRIPELA